MLDDPNILKQRDSGGALEVAAKIYQQANFDCQLRDAEHDARELRNIMAGKGYRKIDDFKGKLKTLD